MAESDHKGVISSLISLGLSQHESAVYLSVLALGEVSAGKVIEDVRLHREQVYRALKRLADDGLLTTYEHQHKAFYSAVEPRILVERVQAKVALAESVLPYLETLHQRKMQIIKVGEGIDSLEAHLEDMLTNLPWGGEYLVISGYGDQFYELAKDYLARYHRKFLSKGLRGRLLLANQPEGEGISSAIPSASFAATTIYGDKMAIEILDPENPAIITIENSKVASSYRDTFESLWRHEKDMSRKWKIEGLIRD